MEPAEWQEKIYRERPRRPWTARRVVAVSAPAKGALTGEQHRCDNEQGPAATTGSAARETALPLTARRFLPGCMKRRPRRDWGRASVHGCCTACPSRQGWMPARAETVYRLRSRQPARTPVTGPDRIPSRRTGTAGSGTTAEDGGRDESRNADSAGIPERVAGAARQRSHATAPQAGFRARTDRSGGRPPPPCYQTTGGSAPG